MPMTVDAPVLLRTSFIWARDMRQHLSDRTLSRIVRKVDPVFRPNDALFKD